MYSHFQLASKYLRYYLTAANGKGHGTHSPFVFDFIINVLNDTKEYSDYSIVEKLRSDLLNNETVLSVEDFGAGSVISKTNQRSIRSIAKSAAKPKKFSQLLYRMVKRYQPHTVLELGTSLGVTTSYLSLAKPDAKVITMEGSSAIAAEAKKNFDTLELKNIDIVLGDFDHTLLSVLSSHPSLDFVFIDGNHRREPTERYFQQLLPSLHNDSIIVFDDIHWSGEMEQAWESIKSHSAVQYTIDLFFIGIVLLKNEFRERQHFTIRF